MTEQAPRMTERAYWAGVFARRDSAAMVAMAAVRALIQGWRWR